MICIHDLEGRILAFNEAAARSVGFEAKPDLETEPQNIQDWLAPETHASFGAYIETIRAVGAASGVMAILTRKGEKRFWEYHNTLRTEGVERPIVRGLAFDITERRRAEATLRDSERRYRLLFERNLAGVFRSTLDGVILDCNESFARIFGCASRKEALAHSAVDFYWTPENRKEALRRLQVKNTLTNYEMCLQRTDGSPVWVLENCALVRGPQGDRTIIEGTIIDISDRKLAEERIHYQAYHDALTGLPNRALFQDRVGLAIVHARRRGQRLAVMFLDLDNFKLINDTLGHMTGDELLKHVAARLKASLREGDTVARVGGDEFTLLLAEVREEKDAGRLARNILQGLSDPFFVNNRELYVAASIGIALYPNDGGDAESLVQHADNAMYRAKDLGRNNCQFYTPLMHRRTLERVALEGQLRHALEREQFSVVYQAQIDVASRGIVGAEALVRWDHPERGMLLPHEFVPVAEEIGLIVSLGEWVLSRACRQMRLWRESGLSPLRVAVNVSSRQFQQATLTRVVEGILSETGLPPRCLDLEITESLAIQNLEQTVPLLKELGRMGLRICMDDFGTGHSSLANLKLLPIHRLKIDQSFISGIGTEERGTSIVKAIITMAHSLGLTVVAEGVETPEQLSVLSAMHCDEVQGFLFGRPLPAEGFEKLLAETASYCN